MDCQKLKTHRHLPDIDNCLRYTDLIQKKCPHRLAINFARKEYCRFDGTQKYVGPSGFKIFKVTSQKLNSKKGWILGNPVLSLQKTQSHRQEIKRNEVWVQKYLENQNIRTEERRKSFTRKIDLVTNYYSKLNTKFKLSKLNKGQLKEKLQKLKENRMNKPIKVNQQIEDRVNEIINNLPKSRKKFQDIIVYQQILKSLISLRKGKKGVNQLMNLMQDEEKALFLKNMMKNHKLIEDFNECFYFLKRKFSPNQNQLMPYKKLLSSFFISFLFKDLIVTCEFPKVVQSHHIIKRFIIQLFNLLCKISNQIFFQMCINRPQKWQFLLKTNFQTQNLFSTDSLTYLKC